MLVVVRPELPELVVACGGMVMKAKYQLLSEPVTSILGSGELSQHSVIELPPMGGVKENSITS